MNKLFEAADRYIQTSDWRIIAVLLGGLAAGIPGMILAVPAAAVLKYLVPKIYQSVRRPKE